MLGQLIISGLSIGFCYALIALAMVIIYKTSEVLNFAQGELAMVSTFVAYALLTDLGVPFLLAFPLTLAFAFALGALVHLCFLRPAREPTLLGLIIITLGSEMILYGTAGWLFGADTKNFPSPISDTNVHVLRNVHVGALSFGDVVVSDLNIAIVVTAVVLMGLLAAFFRFTRLGIAMKATAQNPAAAELMGIRTRRIYTFTWGLSSLTGAVAGMLMAPITMLDPNMMMDPMLKGFASAVLGGMTSLVGCVLGGCILGVVENIVAGYISTEFKSVVAFVIIVAVLCIRPSGLLGKHHVKKV